MHGPSLRFHARCLVNRDGLVHPRQIEYVTSSQVLFSHAAAVRTDRTDLVSEHLVQVASLSRKPVVNEDLRVGPDSISRVPSHHRLRQLMTHANDSRKSRFCLRSRAK